MGRYQLLEPIGIGPSGSVSRAKVFGVAGFERQFAVKRFHAEVTTNSTAAQALSAAARAYGSLEHPRIARMSEFGVAQGTTFTAVEFVVGLDALRLIAEARLAGATLPAGGALALVSQAARAIGYAHGRGLSHLGLSPTNVIVTSEGDIKITDFGILSATLPPRPIDSSRLAHRLQYLAPEQLSGEASSAATDVFALGVLAFELVTGQRTFGGETPTQIAQAVMAGPPADPPLPRPIVRVLQRCLARSPFERFPDARALADALDAALRVAPVPGTRKDIGAQVTQTLERMAALDDGELSGMLALDIGTGPVAKQPARPQPPVAALGRDHDSPDVSTLEFARQGSGRSLRGSAPLVAPPRDLPPASTLPELRPFATASGLPPPPIPVPKGFASVPEIAFPEGEATTDTLIGVQHAKPNPASALGRITTTKVPQVIPSAPLPRAATDSETFVGGEVPPDRPTPLPSRATPSPSDDDLPAVNARRTPQPGALKTNEMKPLVIEQLRADATKATSELLAVSGAIDDSSQPLEPVSLASRAYSSSASSMKPPLPTTLAGVLPPSRSGPITGPPPTPSSIASPPVPLSTIHVVPRSHAPQRSRMPWLLAGLLGIGVLGLGGWLAYREFVVKTTTTVAGSGSERVVVATPDAASGSPNDAMVATGPAVDAAVATGPAVDAAKPATDATLLASPADAATARDAAMPAPTDAAIESVAPDAGTPMVVTPGDSLTITSTPKGARVFLDGSDAGVTPLKLPGTPDRHTIALLLPNHELYVAQVDGQGTFSIPLKEVTPTGGPAGIKVIKCKDKDRYYVFVDGKPTGMTCPTERIETDLGPHVVEVYDVVSETRKKFEIDVKDTRLSYRVKIE